MFNVEYDDYDTILAIRAKALSNLVQGIVLTEWSSMGSDFKSVAAAPTRDVLLATERYLDEYNCRLITQTEPDFR